MFIPSVDFSVYPEILKLIPRLETDISILEERRISLESKVESFLLSDEAKNAFNDYVELTIGDLLEVWQRRSFDSGFWIGCMSAPSFGIGFPEEKKEQP